MHQEQLDLFRKQMDDLREQRPDLQDKCVGRQRRFGGPLVLGVMGLGLMFL